MLILAIDTSFDDTAAAVTRGAEVLSSILSSQLPLYQSWGGVVPKLARRAHEENLSKVTELALKRAGIGWKEIDAIAVTQGPGLAITLEVGIAAAKQYSIEHKKPLVAVNHLEGHMLSVLAEPKTRVKGQGERVVALESIIFPILGVLVSGGTTKFIRMEGIGKYQIVGETQDDAMGEAFDKVGRMLGLGYPAGALVEKLARTGRPGQVIFPIPMRGIKSADTSFSGLKTAASRIIEKIKVANGGTLNRQDICDIALGFQTAAVAHLTQKVKFALQNHEYKEIILGGGVASNLSVRKSLRQLAKGLGIPLLIPYTQKLCVDNAAMIGIAGYFQAKKGNFVKDLSQFDRLPNMSLESAPHPDLS